MMTTPEVIVLDVTRSDIWNGKPKEPRSCPIALSWLRQFPAGRVLVTSVTLYDLSNNKRYRIEAAGQRFTRRFDNSIFRRLLFPRTVTLTELP